MTALRAFREQSSNGHEEKLKTDDAQLVERCKSGDQGAWKELAGRYEKLIAASVRKEMSRMGLLRQCEYEAPDLVQQVWLEITKSIERWDAKVNFAGWIVSIARHRTIDWARSRFLRSKGGVNEQWIKESSLEESPHEHISGSASPEELAGKSELRERMNQALSILPEREQGAWKGVHLEGLTLKQVGARLGISESRVSQIVSSAEHKMADSLKEYREAA